MKTNKFFLAAFAALIIQATICCADDKMIPAEKLPAAAQTFIKKTFPKSTITFAEKDGFVNPTYEVHLSTGTKVDFDRKGNWDKVETHQGAVPAQLIPAAIANYVKTNYPATHITKIDKETYGYEIELSNDLDLKFNKAGALIGIDD